MATAKEGKTKTTTLCITWKEKWKSFSDEWKNNFKMCYCPCRINTYDSDSEEATADNETTFLLHRRDCEEAIKDESNFSLLNKRGSEEAIKDKSKVPPTTVQSASPPPESKKPPKFHLPKPPTHKPTPDKTPTLEQLQELNIEPMRFKTLGYYLEVGQERLNEIGRNSSSVSECLTEMYQVWLERGVNVTWEHLLQALEDVDLMDKAKEVRTKHIQETTNT